MTSPVYIFVCSSILMFSSIGLDKISHVILEFLKVEGIIQEQSVPYFYSYRFQKIDLSKLCIGKLEILQFSILKFCFAQRNQKYRIQSVSIEFMMKLNVWVDQRKKHIEIDKLQDITLSENEVCNSTHVPVEMRKVYHQAPYRCFTQCCIR